MANSFIAAKNPARDLLSTIIRMAHGRDSKAAMLAKVEEYGNYLKVMDCDRRLIADAINEFKRKDLAAELDEMYQWYWKMDCIAGQAAA